MDNSKIKVLYIAGAPRTGSTLLARLLGELDGFLNIGEGIRALFNARLRSQGVPCGCGIQVSDCPFWKDIVRGIDRDAEDFGRDKVRIPYLPLLMSPIKPRAFQKRLEKFLATTENLFKSIKKSANCRVIVDSSKNPPPAYILSQIPAIELYVVHLVRDPRGVVSSWSTPKSYLRRLPTGRVILVLLSFNLLAEWLRIYAKGYLLVRYEDLVENPDQTLKKIAGLVKEGVNRMDFLQGTQARIGPQHVLGSNPDKYIQGLVPIKEQNWDLPRHERILVSLMTFPLLYRYRYFFPGTFPPKSQ